MYPSNKSDIIALIVIISALMFYLKSHIINPIFKRTIIYTFNKFFCYSYAF